MDEPSKTHLKNEYKTPLEINAIKELSERVPNNSYLVVPVVIGGKHLRALLDSGAQPCVLKKSYVPIPVTSGNKR